MDKLATKGAAIGILLMLTLIFFGTSVWLYQNPQAATLAGKVWELFVANLFALAAILRADAGFGGGAQDKQVPPTIPAPPPGQLQS